MSVVIVRDDDANATSDPEAIARTYAPLLDAGIPVSFAVVPAVALDTLAPDGTPEGFLVRRPGQTDRIVELTPETPLARWLRANESVVDVMVHGLSHERVRDDTEFGALTAREARDRLRRGLELLTRALGRTPLGFVAPWDALSRPALAAATSAFDLVSTGFVDRRRLPPTAWHRHVLERVRRNGAVRVGRGWVLRHGGCRILGDTRPEQVPAIVDALCGKAIVPVIVLHHWHFDAGRDPPAAIQALAAALRGRRTGRVRDALRVLDDSL